MSDEMRQHHRRPVFLRDGTVSATAMGKRSRDDHAVRGLRRSTKPPSPFPPHATKVSFMAFLFTRVSALQRLVAHPPVRGWATRALPMRLSAQRMRLHTVVGTTLRVQLVSPLIV